MLEELDRPFVLLGGAAARERAQVAAPAGLRIELPRIETVPARCQLPNHRLTSIDAHRLTDCHAIHDLRHRSADTSGADLDVNCGGVHGDRFRPADLVSH